MTKEQRKAKTKANAIAAKYSRWLKPAQIQNFYAELNEIGVSTGMLCNGATSCEWYFNDEEVENSSFVFSRYSDPNDPELKYEYTIYFS